MPRGEKDNATNWLMQHHPAALVRLVGIAQFRSCKAAHARITLPQALPDGLLEVLLPDQKSPLHLLLEIESYPSKENEEQIVRDMDLAELALGTLPDTVLIVLRQRGKKQSSQRAQRSPLGWARRRHEWRVVELWNVPAEELLALGEVGLVPLLPLTGSREAPETLLQQCKERIEQQGRPQERATLTAVTAMLASLRFGHPERWLELLGGEQVISDFPLLQKWFDERDCQTRQADIVAFLKARFGAVPEELAARIRSVTDLQKLEAAVTLAGRCSSLDAFHKRFAKG
jgi:hypothetical protein